jgi:multiple sugar transport system permease protein
MSAVPTANPEAGARAVESPALPRKATPTGPPGSRQGFLLPSLFMLAFLIYFLMPLVWLFIAATKSNENLFASFGFWFANFDLFDNISEVFAKDNGEFFDWIVNTALYSVVSAVGAALLAAAAGYGFAKYEFRGKNALFWFVLGSVMVPTTALAIPTYLMFAEIGLTNTPWAIILPSLVSPFGIYLMRIYAEGAVSTDLIEAARIDGAGEFRIFRQIAFRLLAPGFVTVLLFTFVATWNNYFLPLVMLSEPRWYPLTVGLAQWNSQATAGGGATAAFNTVLAGALISIVPLIIAFVFLQRYWQSGLSAGSVKG